MNVNADKIYYCWDIPTFKMQSTWLGFLFGFPPCTCQALISVSSCEADPNKYCNLPGSTNLFRTKVIPKQLSSFSPQFSFPLDLSNYLLSSYLFDPFKCRYVCMYVYIYALSGSLSSWDRECTYRQRHQEQRTEMFRCL